MIALLLLLLFVLFGVSSPSSTSVGGGWAPAPTTAVESAPALERVDATRTGGLAYQELSATITDPGTLARLSELLPTPLPSVPGPTGACADCWEYHLVLDFVGANEAIVLDFDQANQPPGLEAFVDAIEGKLE